ncbi:MAG: tetratricopeptide repeat protein [Saprospiraceae bacterium]|nr:tetratricopeptide repeat protein [Saprospiraceae bacterium]
MNSLFKVILKGRLAFGTQKSYDMMIEQYRRRLEQYYKNDILLKGEDHLSEESKTIEVPRTLIPLCTEKTWKNTINMFNELRSYAVAGAMHIWILDSEGKQLIQEVTIIPQGDKFATTEYNRGVSLLRKQGREDEAIDSLTRAIDKYPNYEQAYERRGVANHRLGRTDEAILDFTKSISLHINPEAYLGRAIAKRFLGDLVGAIDDLDLAIKNAVPYQPVFWAARRIKGECHLELSELEKAIFELKLVTKRAFKPTDPNYLHRRKAWEIYAVTLEKAGKVEEAALAHKSAKAIEVPSELTTMDKNNKKNILMPA